MASDMSGGLDIEVVDDPAPAQLPKNPGSTSGSVAPSGTSTLNRERPKFGPGTLSLLPPSLREGSDSPMTPQSSSSPNKRPRLDRLPPPPPQPIAGPSSSRSPFAASAGAGSPFSAFVTGDPSSYFASTRQPGSAQSPGPFSARGSFPTSMADAMRQASSSMGRIPVVSGSNAKAAQSAYAQQQQRAVGFGGRSLSASGVVDLTGSDEEMSGSRRRPKVEEDDIQVIGQNSVAAERAKAVQNRPVASSSRSRAAPQMPVIDLDDDDVKFDDSPVCIGQLITLALILYPIPELSTTSASGNLGRPPSLPCRVLRSAQQHGNETLKLASQLSGEAFAVIEHRVANVIGPLLGSKSSPGPITLEATVHRKNEATPMMLPLELLLFCPPSRMQAAARVLAEAQLYLSHPPSYDPALHAGAQYSNPHSQLNQSGPTQEERRRQMMAALNNGAVGLSQNMFTAVTAPVKKAVDVQKDAIDKVFQSIQSGADLAEVEPPIGMVKTKLYKHQKQALAFLLDRERFRTTDDMSAPSRDSDEKAIENGDMISLWRRVFDTYGKLKGWHNLVTGLEVASSLPPPQTRGAILADDMGLGKTIVIISLIAATLTDARQFALGAPQTTRDTTSHFDAVGVHPHAGTVSKGRASMFSLQLFDMKAAAAGQPGAPPQMPTTSGGSKKKKGESKTQIKREEHEAQRLKRVVTRSRATLIVCPLSTVNNWESQIEEHIGRGGTDGLDVYVYHGPSRTSDPLELAKHDVVLTTFSTLGIEYSRHVKLEEDGNSSAQTAEGDGNDSDGAIEEVDANGNSLASSVPMTPNGSGEVTATMSDKSKKKRKRKAPTGKASPLQQIEWFRVVLDEAHMIKEHTTVQSRAAADLSAERRTCLTGTPLQNALDDLFSLVRFLRLEPFTDRGIWTAYIGAPAKLNQAVGVSRLKLVMRYLALRRTKDTKDSDGNPILNLPPRKDEIVYLEMSEQERAFYNKYHVRYKDNFREMEKTDTLLKNYCSILQELLRLRQICVHPDLVSAAENAKTEDVIEAIRAHGLSKTRAIQLLALMRDTGAAQCAECGCDMVPAALHGGGDGDENACLDDQSPAAKKRKGKGKAALAPLDVNAQDDGGNSEAPAIVTRCQHLFCLACFQRHVCASYPATVQHADRAECSVCRDTITPVIDALQVRPRELDALTAGEATDGQLVAPSKSAASSAFRVIEHSTKIRALLADLIPFSQANPSSRNYAPGEVESSMPDETDDNYRPHVGQVVKTVVFSQWTKVLERIEDALDATKIGYRKLDGTMNRTERNRSIETFRSDPSCEILLVSLRAGGVGLNLTMAQRVYLMEPFWNPAVEAQALDRVHRLGQTQPVKTVRLLIRQSIEESMLKVQKRKEDLANMSIGATLSKQQLAKLRREELTMLMDH